MPNSALLPPDRYPKHWIDALMFLTVNTAGVEVVIENGLDAFDLRNKHVRARAMRISAQKLDTWGPAFKRFAQDGRLRFKARPAFGLPGKFDLVMYSIPANLTQTSLKSQLSTILQKA